MPKSKKPVVSEPSPVFHRVYEIVCTIPKGRVLTYGLISDLLGKRLSAQGVGWALNALPSKPLATDKSDKAKIARKYNSGTVPWHRVINSRGGLSTHKIPDIPPDMQRILLVAEGVVFDDEEKIVLDDYLWQEGLSGS